MKSLDKCICDGGWICETHPSEPWPHGDCGIGMPCCKPECPDSMAVPVEHTEYVEGCMRCKVVYG